MKSWWNPFARHTDSTADILAPAPEQTTAPARMDAWQSAIAGIGIRGKDKRVSATFVCDPVTDIEARELWRGNDMAAKIIETVPSEMWRQGYELSTGDDKEAAEAVTARLEELDAAGAFETAKRYERAYGGAAIFPVINDGSPDLRQPLNLDRILSVEHLQVFEPRELDPVRFYSDPRLPKYGEPEIYRLVPLAGTTAGMAAGVEIHESRLIVWPGIRVSRDQVTGTRTGWGDSVLTRVRNVLRDYGLTWESAGVLVQDFAQAIIKIKGLAEIFATDKDEAFRQRIMAADFARSVLRTMVLDSEEDYERKATPVTGLPELLDRFATRLAAAADMPVTLLMGQSPAGLNATGESDVRFFYDRIAGHQRKETARVERLISLVMRSRRGPTNGVEPDVWSIAWKPLWQPSEQERAQARLTQAQTDQIYISQQVLSPEEVALSRFGGDTYSFETAVDFTARRLLEAPDDVPDDDDQQQPDEGE